MQINAKQIGGVIWAGTLGLLKIAVVAAIGYCVYFITQQFGLSEKQATGAAVLTGILLLCVDFLILMAWILIIGGILAAGGLILTLTVSPPSIYSLVVCGVILLAGILYQLHKIANRPK